ncbi:MAG: D-TA family PLP-dependent enzyme [Bacteroidetes bacterium]|nr:D-TA family PLP-dependent enzyme [Bacteroidota bacterium]
MNEWFHIENVDTVDSPALIIYKERVEQNIRALIERVGDVSRIRPHVKTHKMAAVTELLLEAGITKFKCATIAEAEMLALAGAPDVLLAYQPVGPKIRRLLKLVEERMFTQFSLLVDSPEGAEQIAGVVRTTPFPVGVFVDLNVGMHRTGIQPEHAMPLIRQVKGEKMFLFRGFHAYDGHIADADSSLRAKRVEEAFRPVAALTQQYTDEFGERPVIIAGGSPTYAIHAARGNAECSPGTFIFWDENYARMMPEEPYEHAALVITRVVSVVNRERITVDLGHKSVASENPQPRVRFLNAPDAVPVGHSEEHMVLQVPDASRYHVGDVLYGVPHHICPTVSMYESAAVAEGNEVTGRWAVTARNKRLEH